MQLFRDELFEVHPGAQGRSFICKARVQGAGDEFTESYVVSMNIKFYLTSIVAARRMLEWLASDARTAPTLHSLTTCPDSPLITLQSMPVQK